MFENLSSQLEQHSSRPQVPTPVITFVSSRAPRRRNSTRVPKCAANASLSSARSPSAGPRAEGSNEEKNVSAEAPNFQPRPKILIGRFLDPAPAAATPPPPAALPPPSF